jgi:4-aminobutyrate aminotransferase-like enzyme
MYNPVDARHCALCVTGANANELALWQLAKKIIADETFIFSTT